MHIISNIDQIKNTPWPIIGARPSPSRILTYNWLSNHQIASSSRLPLVSFPVSQPRPGMTAFAKPRLSPQLPHSQTRSSFTITTGVSPSPSPRQTFYLSDLSNHPRDCGANLPLNSTKILQPTTKRGVNFLPLRL